MQSKLSFMRCCLLHLMLALLAGQFAAAQENDAPRPPIDAGFLFVEGTFLPPPYVIRTENDQLLVNDQPILAETFSSNHRPRHFQHFVPPPNFRRGDRLAGALASGNVVLSFEHQPLAILSRTGSGFQLLAQLARQPISHPSVTIGELPPDFDQELLQAWVASYEPTAELHEHAQRVFDDARRAEEDSRQAIAAVRRNDTLLYLVTVFGMVISVAATGHLLSCKPPTAKDYVPDDPDMVKMVSRSLGLVVILSSLDLFWTIMASQSGKMIELNPIGSKLLHDPMQLIAAKAAVICFSVGLLYFLRHHRQAQTAAWWACLICTLLTFRWLTFNSMFV